MFFQLKLHENGTIYKARYSGWYCTPDETFLTESQLKEENGTKYSIESGHPAEWSEEENYMFQLSKYRDEVIRWVDKEFVLQLNLIMTVHKFDNDFLSEIALNQRNFKKYCWPLCKNQFPMFQSPDQRHVYIGAFGCRMMTHTRYMCGWTR